MHTEDIIATLLQHESIVQATGGRIALVQSPQDSGYPALVYQVISATPLDRLCAPGTAWRARVQINPLAFTVREVIDLQNAVRAVLECYTPRTVDGCTVASCVFMGYGPTSKDDLTGAWTKPADYMLLCS